MTDRVLRNDANAHEDEYEDPIDNDEDLDEGEEGEETSSTDLVGKQSVESDTSDDSTGAEETDEEREKIRQRRREERKHKKEAAREREAYLRAELAARDEVLYRMQARLNELEQKSSGGELAQVQKVKQESAQAYAYWKEQIKTGTENQNGALVAEATEKMLQAQARFGQAAQVEEALTIRAKQSQQFAAQQRQPDPRLVYHAERWIAKHPWYSHGGTDPDSKRVASLDAALEREGYDPNTQEYWDELTERVRQHLPHRVNGASMQKEGNRQSANGSRPRSVVGGSGKGSPSSSAKSLSPERVQALKDAGLWDDPAKRDLAIKEFQIYDKEHASR